MRCKPWLMLFALVLFAVARSATAQTPMPLSAYEGDLRMRATFADGEAVVDLGPGEQRLSRIFWVGHIYARRPRESHRGRIAIGDCVVPGRTDGAFAFDPRTDAGLRGLGALNAQSGTFAFWVKRSQVFERGGLLFSGLSMQSGGPRGGRHWAVGVGGSRDSQVVPGHLFVTTSAVQCVADQPMPEDEWVHVAAVWDADMGAKLYVNGREAGSSWRDPRDPEDAVEQRVFYPPDTFREAVETWTISSGVGRRRWHSLLGELPWDDATISWQPEGFLRVEARRTERLQIRIPPIRGLASGPRLAAMRIRQSFPDDLPAVNRNGLSVRITLREEQDGRPAGTPVYERLNARPDPYHEWEELTTVFMLGSGDEGESFAANLDINISGPGVFEIGDLRLIEADPQVIAQMGGTSLLSSHGSYWSDVIHDVAPVPLDRIQLHMHRNGGPVADIHVFDAPLAADEIARLAKGEIFEPGRALRQETVRVDREKRRRWLGWGSEEDGDLIPLAPGRALTVRERYAERIYEDLRAAGSMAADGVQISLTPWPYHGYQHVPIRKLHFKFPEAPQANYLVARGDLSGSLQAGGTRAEPFAGREVLDLPGTPHVFRKVLPRAFNAESATVLRTAGRISGLHFYRVEPNAPGAAPARTFHLHGRSESAPPLCEWKHQEFVSSYGPADRGFLVGSADAGRSPEARPLSALRAHHFFAPATDADFPLAGVGLRLNLRGFSEQTRMQVRVHCPFIPWRELGRWDFLLAPPPRGQAGTYDLTMMLEETLLLEGRSLWATVILDRDSQLVYRPGAESHLTLYEADRSQAETRFLERTLASWRNSFEAISEPRVWGRGIGGDDDGWWLRAASPEYEHMVRCGQEILARFPDEPRANAWFAFIHPAMPNPSAGIEPPEPGPHPRWAVLARANLHLYAQFVDWWTNHRVHPENAEMGNWIGDDTCLVQDWPDLAMIDDADGRYLRVVRNLSDGVMDGTYLSRGRPFIVNGINSRWTDGLHAYEDGLNVQPMNLQLDYGNPVIFHRLLETAARYDGFLLTREENGMRRFNADGRGTIFWSTDREPQGSPYDRNWYLATHAGQTLMWYNGSPKVSEMFAQIASWLFHAREQGEPVSFDRGGWYFLLSLWSRFGEDRYLAELVNLQRARDEGVLAPPSDPAVVKRLPPDLFDPERTAAASRENAETRFDDIGTRWLGFGDRRYERNWFEWFLTRDKSYLEEGLVALYQRLKFSMPAVTVAEQSGDRVSVPKQLISHMYLGGVPVARNNQFYPKYAVSYEGMGRDFAALVLDDTEDLLRVLFYNFEDAPRSGLMRVWGLGPGEFEIAGGPDRNGNDRMDAVVHRRRKELVRGDGIEIQIPPQQLVVWEARRVRAGRPLWERPDLAVAAEEAEWGEDGTLTLPVHNIGAAASGSVSVALQSQDGRTVARRTVAQLEPPLDLQPKAAPVRFAPREVAQAAGRTGAVVVVVDPENTLEEITRRNNQAEIMFP